MALTDVIHDPDSYVAGAPLDALDELREIGDGVHRVREPDGPGYWLVTRHADVRAVLRDASVFSSWLGATQVRDPATPQDLAYVRRMMLNMDPPEHTRLRQPMVRSFTMRAVAQLESRIGGHVAGILERGLEPLVERTVVRSTSDDPGAERTNRVLSLDFAKEIAADLPLLAMADVLGVPAQDRLLMFDWSNRVIGFQDPDYATSASFDPASGSAIAREAWALRPTPDESGRMPDPRTRAGMPDLYAYAHLLATAKRAEPGDDVMSNWLAGGLGEDDPVSVEEFENMFWLFAVAGNETLRNGLPGGMIALLDHPDAQRELRDNPALLDSAVEEMLRWWTPVMVFRRTATRDSVIGATRIAAGDKVVVSFLAANRDPREFEDPAAFRIDRFVDGGSGRHLVFGHGPHLCLGAHLARLQMRTLFSALLAKTTWIEPAGDPVFLRSSFQRGVKRLPVRLR
ncbi:MAG: cytochrome P450 [Nocardioides sp.]